jgi:hypothetical protein
MNYLQTNESSFNAINPLLMNYTPVTKIEMGENIEPVFYDPVAQIVYDMRQVGTKCRKSTSKKLPGGSYSGDAKNEMDDSKSVK